MKKIIWISFLLLIFSLCEIQAQDTVIALTPAQARERNKNMLLSSWYTSSSYTSSSTLERRELINNLTSQLLRNNYDLIAEESVQGKGEHLEALVSLMGCPSTVSLDFYSFLKSNHAHLFNQHSKNNPDHFRDTLALMIQTAPMLNQTCTF